MFFRVLSAMLTADAIDRHIRTQQPRYWYPQAPQPTDQAVTAPVSRQSRSHRGVIAPASAWDPRAPERPW
jgi:hypothetical protein